MTTIILRPMGLQWSIKNLISHSTLRAFMAPESRRSLSKLSKRGEKKNNKNHINQALFLGAATVAVIGAYFLANKRRNDVHAIQNNHKNFKCGDWRPDLPTFTKEDVRSHFAKETGMWTSFREGVYDFTDYVDRHPGGTEIMAAAGKSLDFFFRLYGLHEFEHILVALEKLRIGNLNKKDQVKMIDFNDPYESDPTRHPDIEALCTKPFCGGVKLSLLADNFYTPNEYFFIRSHLPVPQIDPKTYEFYLEVEGTDKKLKFTLEDIKKLPQLTITCTLMCAGNRRSEMMKVINKRAAVAWGPNAMGNAKWTGVRLRDLLKMVDVTEEESEYQHVQFEGQDLDANGNRFTASIPIWKAVDKYGDVILAYEMNGAPLPPDHGFPLRLIIPGTGGTRSVKWLARILVSRNESPGHYQQIDYKAFAPSTNWCNVDYKQAPAVQSLPVISAICRPNEGQLVQVQDGCINIKGYAYSGGGQKVLRVDVTIDGGKLWHTANFDHQDNAKPPHHWSWTLWSIKIPVDKEIREVEIWCKAVDSSFNTQPETFQNIFNFKGVLCNAYHRVKIKLKQ